MNSKLETRNSKLHDGHLIRGLGPVAAISINVGNIIGTGVFLKARVMTCNVGTPGRVIAVWIAAGLLALAGALTYAELTTMRPEAGAEYVITRDAYGRPLAFLYGWSQFLISRTASAAALAVGFAIFLNDLVGGSLGQVYYTLNLPGGHQVPFGRLQLVALVTIAVTTLINCAAVSVSGHVASLITILKVLLVLGVGVGAFFYQDGHWSNLMLSSTAGKCEGVSVVGGGFSGFAAAMLGALWAYDGWNNISYMAGEVKRPERNLPLALISSMLIVMVLYVIANVSYYYVLTPTEVASVSTASSVAAEATRRVVGPLAVSLIAGIMMLSSFGALQTSILGTARVPFAMARDKLFFASLARVSKKTHVPVVCLIVQAVWAGVLALSGSYDQLTDYAIFAFWLFYGLVTGAVFVFRWRQPNAERPYKTWGYPVVPALFVLVTIYLIVFTIKNAPLQSSIGLLIIAIGLPVYWYFLRYSKTAFRAVPKYAFLVAALFAVAFLVFPVVILECVVALCLGIAWPQVSWRWGLFVVLLPLLRFFISIPAQASVPALLTTTALAVLIVGLSGTCAFLGARYSPRNLGAG